MGRLEAMTAAERALTFITEGNVVGLGTGRAATEFIRALGAKVQGGLRVRGVATSEATATLARSLGIEVISIDDVDAIDVAVDGADEVDPRLSLIKGYGGALLREKIVAAAAKQVIILVGPEKLVPVLGTRGRLPVEVLPFGHAQVARRLATLGHASTPRSTLTDNGNRILDCSVGPIADPAGLDAALRAIPGVMATGLFVGMAHRVLVQDGSTVRLLERE
jgi:ribose 5-phosphate isomerase A